MSIRRTGSMRGELRELKKQVQAPVAKTIGVRDWFVGESAETIARKVEVWTLLQWYHERYVLPNLGLRGFFRRLYVRLFGKRLKSPGGKTINVELLALISPWQEYRVKAALRAALAELDRCPIGFLEEGNNEPIACELPRGHDGNHVAGSFSWADEQPGQTPAPPGTVVEA